MRWSKNALTEHPISTTTKAKKDAPIVPKERKVSTKARPRGKAPVRSVVVDTIEKVVASGVVVAKTASRSINLPQSFR